MLVRSPSHLHRTDRLRDLLPLNTPLSLQIDTTNLCNFRCVFCPTGNEELLQEVGRPKGVMAPKLFAKIVADLKGFGDKIRDVYLYKDGEPLINNKLSSMIGALNAADVADLIHITTNGSLLTIEKAASLIDAGLNAVRISIYGADEETYARLTRRPGMFEKVRENVRGLFELKKRRGAALHVHCKIVDANLTEDQKQSFLAGFESICDSWSINSIMGWSNTGAKDLTLGLEPVFGIANESELNVSRKVCPEPFRKLAINFDGRVSACCVDWKFAAVVGDVRTENLVDIWNGATLRSFRLAHLRGMKNSLEACQGCQFVEGFSNNLDLDDVAEKFIPLY